VSASAWGSWGRRKGRAFRHAPTNFCAVITSRLEPARDLLSFCGNKGSLGEDFTKGEVPHRLKPDLLSQSYGSAEAEPLLMSGQANLGMSWSKCSLAPLALVLAALGAPYLLTRGHGHPAIALSLQHAFALVCHQLPGRSFWIFGAPIPVCARCLGIYLGSALGLLLRTSRRIALHLLIAAVALNALDWLTEAAGLHGNWLTMRFVFGLALGAGAALLISSSMPMPALAHRLDSTN
jgi:uncharacterized membrane protein